jgi:DNA-binding XRE family transcriptional regulator
MANDRDPESDPAAFLGAELRRARLAAGIDSQELLARELGVDRTVITKAETGERPPSTLVATALDTRFPHLDGLFSRLAVLARKVTGIPGWFLKWVVDGEDKAVVLRWWEPLLIPGLLQTPEYARALFRAWEIADSDDGLEEHVTGRIARQAILDRTGPPKLSVVIDETVLYRCVGGPKVMHDQLVKLAEMGERPGISVQVIPADAGAHIGLLGAFAIADIGDGSAGIVYMESPDEGQTTKDPATVAKLVLVFDTLRSEALSRGASRDRVMKVAEEKWT